MVRKKKTEIHGNNPSGGMKKEKDVIASKSVRKKTGRKGNLHKSNENNISENIKLPKQINKNQNKSILKLGNILGISDVNELYKRLHDLINTDRDVLIDASDVQSVDTAVLQLLTAFCLKVGRNGHDIKWKNPTQTFIDRCCLLNLEELLKLN